MIKSSKWLETKECTNRVLKNVIPQAESVEDKVSDFYNNNLPKAMEAVAIWVFRNPEKATEPDLKEDLDAIREAMTTLEQTGSIG